MQVKRVKQSELTASRAVIASRALTAPRAVTASRAFLRIFVGNLTHLSTNAFRENFLLSRGNAEKEKGQQLLLLDLQVSQPTNILVALYFFLIVIQQKHHTRALSH